MIEHQTMTVSKWDPPRYPQTTLEALAERQRWEPIDSPPLGWYDRIPPEPRPLAIRILIGIASFIYGLLELVCYLGVFAYIDLLLNGGWK